MRKRTLISLILTVVMLLTASGIASASDSWEYYFPITVSDNTGVTRTMYPIILEVGGQHLVDTGYMTANGTDARLRTTADKNLLLSSDNIAFAVDNLPAYGQVTYNLYTGYSPEKSDYQIIVGDGGYVAVVDEDSIELGDNFTIEQSGWVDTAFDAESGNAKLLVDKTGAFGAVVSATENITSIIKGDAWASVAARPVVETGIQSLAVLNGKLYGGSDPNGRLYEWNGTNAWVEAAPQSGDEGGIQSMVVYDGKIYGGTISDAELLEWNGVDEWVRVAPQLAAETGIYSLAVFNDKVYGGTGVLTGELYEWNGTNAWVSVASQLGAESAIWSLAVYNGKLYGGTEPNGKLYEWDGVDEWVEVAPKLGDETSIKSLVVYNGKLYGGTGALTGELYEWNGTNAWVSVAPQLGDEKYIWSMAVFNGKLYGGTGILGKLYEWNGTNAWVEVAPKLGAETIILSMAVFDGKLYGGTFSLANLFEWDSVSVTTTDVEREEYIIATTANTTHLWHIIDGTPGTPVALSGISVKNTTANWTFSQNNAMPYADNITITVDGVRELWFQPNEMITGTTLPDRATSVANDGTITWGSNDGVEIVFGSVRSYEATTSTASVNVTGFVLPLVGIPDNWWGMEFDGEDLPFYPTFLDTSTQTGIPVQTLYLLMVFGAAIALATVTIVLTRSVLVGVAFYTITMSYGANAGIVAWWIIYVFLIMVIGIIFLSSRQAMGG